MVLAIKALSFRVINRTIIDRTCCWNRNDFLNRGSLLFGWNQCRTKFKRVGDRPIGQEIQILGERYRSDEWTNVPDKVISLIGRQLYSTPGNPIYLISESLRQHFSDHQCHHFLNPVVDLWSNFDSILVPSDHISRGRADTFYVDKDRLLRSHTSAHQSVCFKNLGTDGRKFMIIGDVYRRDEVNRTHHAAFHQCEIAQLYSVEDKEMASAGITSLFDDGHLSQSDSCQRGLSEPAVRVVEKELKSKTESYMKRLLGPGLKMRWIDGSFPFTHPSWELEIWHQDDWMEMLGCGIVQQSILDRDGQSNRIGWALGIGLERMAMLYYSIPDIRLFWTTDSGFLVQFADLRPFERVEYKPISSYPQKNFDISFWLPENEERVNCWSSNDVHAIILDVGGELVEQAHLVEEWSRPSDGRTSNCYRITYRSHERALTNSEVNVVHGTIEKALVEQLQIEIR